MRDLILIERKRRLENFLHKVETTSPPPHLVGRWTNYLIELYVGYLRAEDSVWPNSKLTTADALRPFNEIKVYMYVHGPVQKRMNEALRKLNEGNIKAVAKMLMKLASEEEGKNIHSEIQKINRSKRGRHEGYNQLLDQFYKDDPNIKTPQLLQRLRKEAGKGVISRIDDRNNRILLEDGKEFLITGLDDQLSKRRKKL
jgi:hypothetical protein